MMNSRSSRLSSHTPRPPSAPLSLVPSGEAVPWGWNRRREPWGVDTMGLQHFIVVPFKELLGENDMIMIYPSPSKGFCYDISIVLMKNRVKCPAWESDSITTIIRSLIFLEFTWIYCCAYPAQLPVWGPPTCGTSWDTDQVWEQLWGF